MLLLLVSLLFAVLYWGALEREAALPLLLPGSLLAVVGWVIASVAFAFYVGNFGSYNKTWSLAGPIVFLLWLWISNICVLGLELNAELERSRKLESGEVAHEEEQFVEVRDDEKIDDSKS